MKYIFLGLSLLLFTFFFYKGLKKDPSIIPSNLIEKDIPDFQLKKTNSFPFFEKSDLLKNKGIENYKFFCILVPPAKLSIQI